MTEFYLKKVVNTEKQLELAKIGYREELLRLSIQMARTSRKESDELMQQINEYAEAIIALEESLNEARKSFVKAKEEKEQEEKNNEDNK